MEAKELEHLVGKAAEEMGRENWEGWDDLKPTKAYIRKTRELLKKSQASASQTTRTVPSLGTGVFVRDSMVIHSPEKWEARHKPQ